MKTSYDIIRKPIITEKSSSLIDKNLQYTFEVDPKANKVEIKKQTLTETFARKTSPLKYPHNTNIETMEKNIR
jgi:ribosomal protein L23